MEAQTEAKADLARQALRAAQLTDAEIIALAHDWPLFARPEQLPPEGDWWRTWLFLAGRGAGKTRAGAEWVRAQIKRGFKRIGLIAPTAASARDIMVEGESGILAICWANDRAESGEKLGRPMYEPSKRRLTWGNGALATLYSAEEPDRLRGPQHDAIWADELASWTNAQEAWDMAMFGLRLGRDPRVMISTTPRPLGVLQALIREPTTAVTRSTTHSNAANLADAFMSQIIRRYEGTRLGRQELLGELLEESENALWSRAMLEQARIATLPKSPDGQPLQMRRVVVGVDPAVTAKEDSNLTGIVAAGVGADGRGYVLADASGRYTPDAWARKAVGLFQSLKADRIVAEGNQGGEMVRHTILSVAPNTPVTIVHASRGKQARAEPVAALYEQGKISHVGAFTRLEDQMCTWEPLGDQPSPDRIDALVWALTALMIQQQRQAAFGIYGTVG